MAIFIFIVSLVRFNSCITYDNALVMLDCLAMCSTPDYVLIPFSSRNVLISLAEQNNHIAPTICCKKSSMEGTHLQWRRRSPNRFSHDANPNQLSWNRISNPLNQGLHLSTFFTNPSICSVHLLFFFCILFNLVTEVLIDNSGESI